jgi:hypothetical protein
VGAARVVPGRRGHRRAARGRPEVDAEGRPARGGGVRRGAVARLHDAAGRRLGRARRQWARAPELARRHPEPGRRRGDRARVALRARDLPRVEREAAAAGGPRPLPLRRAAADALALAG